jgi:hypothetical protein
MRRMILSAALILWGAAGAAQAGQSVTFLCSAPAGHTCQFGIQTAAGPIKFSLPSGKRKGVANLMPHSDKYCVCDPGPVTADCKAPQLGKWCMGQWLDVTPGLNSENDPGNNDFARN